MSIPEIDALNERAWDLRENDAQQALALSQQARQAAEESQYPHGQAQALLCSGACRWMLADMGGMADLFEALRLFRQVGYQVGEGLALNWIGNLYFRSNEYETSLQYHQQSLRLRRQIGDRKGEAASLNNSGLVYYDLARYDDALECYFQGIKICEEDHNLAVLSSTLNNLGLVYERLGDLDRALECQQRALEIKRSLDNLQGISGSLNNLGSLYQSMGRLDEARDCHQQALVLNRQASYRHGEAVTLINLGELHQIGGDLEQALECFNQALDVLRQAGDRYAEAETLLDVGANYQKRGMPAQALSFLLHAQSLAVMLQSNDLIARSHEALATAYEEQKDFERALTHYKAFHQAQAAVFTAESDHRRHLLQIQSEIEQAQREAEIHRLRNVELAQAYRDLEQSDKHKEALLFTLRQQAEQLERLTREDSLTGVANRRHLDQQAELEFERAQRFSHSLCAAMLDIDDFKQINDRFSHLAGDAVLRAVAQTLRSGCRSVDMVGRYGGEEFLILLVETGLPNGLALCERLRQAIETYHWLPLHPDLKVTVSIGVADNANVADLQAQLSLADARLYRAKQAGKNRVCGDS